MKKLVKIASLFFFAFTFFFISPYSTFAFKTGDVTLGPLWGLNNHVNVPAEKPDACKGGNAANCSDPKNAQYDAFYIKDGLKGSIVNGIVQRSSEGLRIDAFYDANNNVPVYCAEPWKSRGDNYKAIEVDPSGNATIVKIAKAANQWLINKGQNNSSSSISKEAYAVIRLAFSTTSGCTANGKGGYYAFYDSDLKGVDYLYTCQITNNTTSKVTAFPYLSQSSFAVNNAWEIINNAKKISSDTLTPTASGTYDGDGKLIVSTNFPNAVTQINVKPDGSKDINKCSGSFETSGMVYTCDFGTTDYTKFTITVDTNLALAAGFVKAYQYLDQESYQTFYSFAPVPISIKIKLDTPPLGPNQDCQEIAEKLNIGEELTSDEINSYFQDTSLACSCIDTKVYSEQEYYYICDEESSGYNSDLCDQYKSTCVEQDNSTCDPINTFDDRCAYTHDDDQTDVAEMEYADPTDFYGCIIGPSVDPNVKAEYEYTGKTSNYCQFYCREEFRMTFPGERYTASGRFFTVSANSYDFKECGTDKIEQGQFRQDYNDQRKYNVEPAINNWEVSYAFDQAEDNDSQYGSKKTYEYNDASNRCEYDVNVDNINYWAWSGERSVSTCTPSNSTNCFTSQSEAWSQCEEHYWSSYEQGIYNDCISTCDNKKTEAGQKAYMDFYNAYCIDLPGGTEYSNCLVNAAAARTNAKTNFVCNCPPNKQSEVNSYCSSEVSSYNYIKKERKYVNYNKVEIKVNSIKTDTLNPRSETSKSICIYYKTGGTGDISNCNTSGSLTIRNLASCSGSIQKIGTNYNDLVKSAKIDAYSLDDATDNYLTIAKTELSNLDGIYAEYKTCFSHDYLKPHSIVLSSSYYDADDPDLSTSIYGDFQGFEEKQHEDSITDKIIVKGCEFDAKNFDDVKCQEGLNKSEDKDSASIPSLKKYKLDKSQGKAETDWQQYETDLRTMATYQSSNDYYQSSKFYAAVPTGELVTTSDNALELPLNTDPLYNSGKASIKPVPLKRLTGRYEFSYFIDSTENIAQRVVDAINDRLYDPESGTMEYHCYYYVSNVNYCPPIDEADVYYQEAYNSFYRSKVFHGSNEADCYGNEEDDFNFFVSFYSPNNFKPNNRQLGANWETTEGQAVKNKIIADAETIYNENDPAKGYYKFVLSPRAIVELRSVNDSAEKRGNGYNDFTLSCTNGNNCKSEVLTDIAKMNTSDYTENKLDTARNNAT